MVHRRIRHIWQSSASHWEWWVASRQTYSQLICWQNLKRIEVIADDEAEIIEAVQRMSTNYDFVVTSGGIGPTWVPSSI